MTQNFLRSLPKESELPDSLNGLPYLNALQIRTHPDTESDMRRLIKSIDKEVFPYKAIKRYGIIASIVTLLSFTGYSQYDNVNHFLSSFSKTPKVGFLEANYDWKYKLNNNGQIDGEVIGYYKYTKNIAIKGIYKNGLKDGKYAKYNKQGNKIEDRLYQNNLKLLERKYFDNGNLMSITHFNKEGKKEGEIKYFYSNGVLKYDANYTNGNVGKLAKKYYESGNLSYLYINDIVGIQNGRGTMYYDDKKQYILAVWKYKDHKLDGVETFFYKGKPQQKSIELFYTDGNLTGEYIIYDKATGKVIDKDYNNNVSRYIYTYYYKNPSNNIQSVSPKNKNKRLHGKYKEFYENGNIKQVTLYRDGKKDGISTYFYKGKPQQKSIESLCTDGNLTGEYIIYDKATGKVIDKDYNNNVSSYTYKYYYNDPSNNIQSVSPKNKNKRLHGKYKEFYENGNIKQVTLYRDGKKDGISTYFYKEKNKQKLVDIFYENDKSTGKYILYDKDTNKVIDKDININAIYKWIRYSNDRIKDFYSINKDGSKDGKYKRFYEDGKIKNIWTYKNGKLDGGYKKYNKSGQIIESGNYKNGIKISKIDYFSSGHKKYLYIYNKNGKVDGIIKGYFDSERGELASIWTYKNGKPDGKFERYYKDGALKQEGAYVNGKKEIYADY